MWLQGRLGEVLGRRPAGRMIILYYHDVPASLRPRFAQQMDILLRHAVPVPANYSGPLEPGRLHVAVTFDDGFKSVLENAIPELERRQLPATIFVPTGVFGRNPTWGFTNEEKRHREIVMVEGELRGLSEKGVIIGSHSVSHPRLPGLNQRDLKHELDVSRSTLESVLGREVDLFSFPYGAHDARVAEACQRAGYKRAFSILPSPVDPQKCEFVRGRVSVDPDDSDLRFVLKMSGAYSWLPAASAIKSRLTCWRPARLRRGEVSRPNPKVTRQS